MNQTMGTTKHKEECKMAFGRKDSTCPRCQELLAGAKPRAGWSDNKRMFEAQSREYNRNHDCKASNCGPVCTFGDW